MLPVVMGAPRDDYCALAPPNSFIHVDDFSSPAELAKYLNWLDLNDTAYASYFAWKDYGRIMHTDFSPSHPLTSTTTTTTTATTNTTTTTTNRSCSNLHAVPGPLDVDFQDDVYEWNLQDQTPMTCKKCAERGPPNFWSREPKRQQRSLDTRKLAGGLEGVWSFQET
ncbi:unnamed protein product [Dibothriocephalus latus]|uniref:Fucosyltransferase n=1 Tax=Dibothriocephalus latus TaxID=60516 RepID=A0A3P7P3I8_DIBLA|nr:unnamed protein product [Dibothriocephalus latus]